MAKSEATPVHTNSYFLALIQNDVSHCKDTSELTSSVCVLCQLAENTLMSTYYKPCPEIHLPFAVTFMHMLFVKGSQG